MKRTQQFKTGLIALLTLCIVNSSAYGKWTTLTSTPTPGRWGAMSFVLDGKIFISGGYIGNFQNKNDLLVYDPVTDKWNFKNGLPGNVMRTEGVSFVINGKAYLGLGAQDYNNFSPPPIYFADLWEYDAATDTWTAKANFPSNGVSDAAVFVLNNKAYIVGGSEGSVKSTKTWEYDPATDKWTAKADYPGGGVRNASGFAVGNKGYVVGGEIGTTPTNKLYEYNPVANTWTEKKAYPKPAIWGGVSMVINNRAYVGLGAEGPIGASTMYSNHFFAYDQTADDWVYWQGAELGNSRMHGTAVVLNNKAYMGNGWKLDGSSQVFYNDWYAVDPQDIVGIDEIQQSNTVAVYPNPANDVLHIRSGIQYTAYKLYNITGQVVAEDVLHTNTINVGNLPRGMYHLQLSGTEGTSNKTVSIQ